MLKPATLYDYEPYDDDVGTLVNDELLVILGGFIFLSVFPIGCCAFYVLAEPLIKAWCGKCKPNIFTLLPTTWRQVSVLCYG